MKRADVADMEPLPDHWGSPAAYPPAQRAHSLRVDRLLVRLQVLQRLDPELPWLLGSQERRSLRLLLQVHLLVAAAAPVVEAATSFGHCLQDLTQEVGPQE